MGVRVKLKLRSPRSEVETAALVNSGFETLDPEIIIPLPLAEYLGLTPSKDIESYRVGGGSVVSAFRSLEKLWVKVIVNDRDLNEIKSIPTIVPGEDEVIISDRLAYELRKVLIDPYRGLWCLRDELGNKIRESVEPDYWR